uniref:Uncharacterized protein n=1 Tax=Vitrella brassicaformis TaxID=1169539 RepID=A0A7S1P0T2_9ALVE|mmetsp:Transcript_21660/g.53075  ORF Transcript_21660/g.53075 Transcript_21660/m.53075 type:complete len:277 (+) Transcript_21660:26-856(+)
MMGSSPRVMTLEEAGDQLIRAERAAKGSITITLPASGGTNCLLFLLLVVLGGAAWAHVVIGDINRVQLVAHEATIKALQQHLQDNDALIGQHEVAMGEKEAANVLLQDQLATATADLATATADLKNKTAAITAFHEQVARLTEDLHNTTEALQQRDEAIVALEDRFQATERALARANGLLDKGRGALNRIFWITAGALSLTVCCWAGGVMATWLHEKTREEKETSINRNTLHEKTASAKGGRCNVTPRDLCLRWPARERRGAIVTGLGCTYVGWVM